MASYTMHQRIQIVQLIYESGRSVKIFTENLMLFMVNIIVYLQQLLNNSFNSC